MEYKEPAKMDIVYKILNDDEETIKQFEHKGVVEFIKCDGIYCSECICNMFSFDEKYGVLPSSCVIYSDSRQKIKDEGDWNAFINQRFISIEEKLDILEL